MPWLTGDEIPTGTKCREIRVPDDPTFVSAVSGALLDLTRPENWEQHGTLTPQQMADAMLDAYFSFAESECVEPMVQVYPEQFFIHPTQLENNGSGALTFVNLSNLFNAMSVSILPVAQFNQMQVEVFCRAGQYDLFIAGQRNTTYGISTIHIIGAETDPTLDWYNAAAQVNIVQSQQVMFPNEGQNIIQLKMLTKNASSSNYDFKPCALWGVRTGA